MSITILDNRDKEELQKNIDKVSEDVAELTEEIAKLPTGGGGSSVQADWAVNDENNPAFVKNRTHWLERPYEPIVVTESTVGAEGVDTVDVSVLFGYPAGTAVLYKVSDHVLTADDSVVSNVFITETDGGEYSGPVTVTGLDGMPGFYTVAVSVYDYENEQYHNEKSGLFSVAVSGDFTAEIGIVIPSTGLYIMRYDDTVASFEINADTYHTIDKRYLPDSCATKEYVDGLITGAIGGSY